MSRLMVIVPDRLTDIIKKGEFQPCYYNPGNLFDEVHLCSTTPDKPDLAALQHTVGTARLHFHVIPEDLDLCQRDWRRDNYAPLRQWARPGVELAARIQPNLIRLHGADWNIWVAKCIREELGIPFVVSLHINPDINQPRQYPGPNLEPHQIRHNEFFAYIQDEGLRAADLVMPVYEPIIPFLERVGVVSYKVCYNILDGQNLRPKERYDLAAPPRLLYVGRVFGDKNPEPIILALEQIPDATLTIVGDGPLRVPLEMMVQERNLQERVHFRPAVHNAELCRMLGEFDLFTIHTEYFELNKSLLEALLTGLPAVLNRRRGTPVPELAEANIVRFVDPTPDSYADAIRELLANHAGRAALGRRAAAHAQTRWAPALTEAKVVSIYRRFMR
ncbi:glycosyltransferase [Azospirillum brasilense]|uniref:glycosyltransferase n=1 Tax=Azospirillum brasilense TaxID=192 RepID=UPI000E0AE9EC|nr:glycosyltransferase [Azospirillum brasilense]